MRLVLASTSPRRRELLALLGVSFEVSSPNFEEQPLAGLSPAEQVGRFALEKARSVALAHPDDLVLGSDTVIDMDGRMLGKPRDLPDARRILTHLAGRSHLVLTAVALCCRAKGVESVEVAAASVWMRANIDQTVAHYLETGESLGKAGAYSIQGLGGDLVERITGDYTTVVGLPLQTVAKLLRSAGYPVRRDVEELYRQRAYPNWSRFAA